MNPVIGLEPILNFRDICKVASARWLESLCVWYEIHAQNLVHQVQRCRCKRVNLVSVISLEVLFLLIPSVVVTCTFKGIVIIAIED